MKKLLVIILILTIIVLVTIKNEDLIFQNYSIELNTKNLKNLISLPKNKDDGRVELTSSNTICKRYIQNNILSIKELNNKDDNLSHIFKIIKKRNISSCNFNIIIFKRHPNPFIALFLVHIPIIIILYLIIKIFLTHTTSPLVTRITKAKTR